METRELPSGSATTELPSVSIVVPTYCRPALLRECLASIERLEYPIDRFELILVDDGSGDETADVLRAFARSTRLRCVVDRQPHLGIGPARNLGVSHVQGPLVAFTDDDCTVEPQWLRSLVRPFCDDSVVGVGGIIWPRSQGMMSDFLTFHHVWANHPGGSGQRPFLITANACYRTEAVRAVGGFHAFRFGGGSEDIDLAWRIADRGGMFQIASDAVVLHFHRTRLRAFATMFLFYGSGHAQLLAKHRILESQRSAWQDFRRALSARYYVFRARQYVRIHHLDLGDAMRYAALDLLRNLFWSLGFWGARYWAQRKDGP